MKTKISNLPVELLEEILSRVSMKSIGAVRSTCKTWKILTKDQRFAIKHIEKAEASQREKEVLMITGDTKGINVKFYDFNNKTFEPSTKRNGILITTDGEVFLHRVFYCNGVLLCQWKNVKRWLMVWNPYWGKIRWINNPTERLYEMFAFGYDKSCGSHKIFRLSSDDNINIHIDIYDLSCDSWKTPPDVAFQSNLIDYTKPGLSLKGNTYWYDYDKESLACFLQCFDFTGERFGPRLPPPEGLSYGPFIASLSSVKEEKLALLSEQSRVITVWVTDKIEPDYVSWSKFFNIQTFQLYGGYPFWSFLIDEEKKIAVLFYDNWGICYNTYIIDGERGNIRRIEITEPPNLRLHNLVGCYVPSSVHI